MQQENKEFAALSATSSIHQTKRLFFSGLIKKGEENLQVSAAFALIDSDEGSSKPTKYFQDFSNMKLNTQPLNNGLVDEDLITQQQQLRQEGRIDLSGNSSNSTLLVTRRKPSEMQRRASLPRKQPINIINTGVVETEQQFQNNLRANACSYPLIQIEHFSQDTHKTISKELGHFRAINIEEQKPMPFYQTFDLTQAAAADLSSKAIPSMNISNHLTFAEQPSQSGKNDSNEESCVSGGGMKFKVKQFKRKKNSQKKTPECATFLRWQKMAFPNLFKCSRLQKQPQNIQQGRNENRASKVRCNQQNNELQKMQIQESTHLSIRYIKLMVAIFAILAVIRWIYGCIYTQMVAGQNDASSNSMYNAIQILIFVVYGTLLFQIKKAKRRESKLFLRVLMILIGVTSFMSHNYYLLIFKPTASSSPTTIGNGSGNLMGHSQYNYTKIEQQIDAESIINDFQKDSDIITTTNSQVCRLFNNHGFAKIIAQYQNSCPNNNFSQFIQKSDLKMNVDLLQMVQPVDSNCLQEIFTPILRTICSSKLEQTGRSAPNNLIPVKNHDANEDEQTLRIFLFGVFFLSHLYVDIFLIIHSADSIILNALVWTCFQISCPLIGCTNPTLFTRGVICLFGLTVLNFTKKARKFKDRHALSFIEQKYQNNMWLGIFKKMPVGIVVTDSKQKVIHVNKKVHQITGLTRIKNMADLDKSLMISAQSSNFQRQATLSTAANIMPPGQMHRVFKKQQNHQELCGGGDSDNQLADLMLDPVQKFESVGAVNEREAIRAPSSTDKGVKFESFCQINNGPRNKEEHSLMRVQGTSVKRNSSNLKEEEDQTKNGSALSPHFQKIHSGNMFKACQLSDVEDESKKSSEMPLVAISQNNDLRGLQLIKETCTGDEEYSREQHTRLGAADLSQNYTSQSDSSLQEGDGPKSNGKVGPKNCLSGDLGPEEASEDSSTYTFLLQDVDILGDRMTIIVFQDVTQQQKQYKQTLEQKYKNIFLSSVSHQLRTPLNILQMNNSILRGLLKDNQLASDILSQDNKTHDLFNYQIADILDYAKNEAEEFALSFAEFSPRDLFKRIKAIYEPMATQKKLFFNMTVGERVPALINLDEQRLGQILSNIVGNSVKYTFKGSISTTVDFDEGHSEMTIEVRDTGKGIENLGVLGHIFGNLSVIDKVNQNGMGFGVTICKILVSKMNGEIAFRNIYGGSRESSLVQTIISGLSVVIKLPIEVVKLRSEPTTQGNNSNQNMENSLKQNKHQVRLSNGTFNRRESVRGQSQVGSALSHNNAATTNSKIHHLQQSAENSINFLDLKLPQAKKKAELSRKDQSMEASSQNSLNIGSFNRHLALLKKSNQRRHSWVRNQIPVQPDAIITNGGELNQSKPFMNNTMSNFQIQLHSSAKSFNEFSIMSEAAQELRLINAKDMEEDPADDDEDMPTIESKVISHTIRIPMHTICSRYLGTVDQQLVNFCDDQSHLSHPPQLSHKLQMNRIIADDWVSMSQSPQERIDSSGKSLRKNSDNDNKQVFTNANHIDSQQNDITDNIQTLTNEVTNSKLAGKSSFFFRHIKHKLLAGGCTAPSRKKQKKAITASLKILKSALKVDQQKTSQPIKQQSGSQVSKVLKRGPDGNNVEDMMNNTQQIQYEFGSEGFQLFAVNNQDFSSQVVQLNNQLAQQSPKKIQKETHFTFKNILCEAEKKPTKTQNDLSKVFQSRQHAQIKRDATMEISKTPKCGGGGPGGGIGMGKTSQNHNSGSLECCNRILIVDDNPFNVKSIELMLEHCFQLACDTAFSGQEALRLIEKRLEKLHKFGCSESYRLILTDINMPEMDGIQMTKKIRQIYLHNITVKKSMANNYLNFSRGIAMHLHNQHDQMSRVGSNATIKGLKGKVRQNEDERDCCCIWAITAMNEAEIQDQVNEECLNGISVKPMSFKALQHILYSQQLIDSIQDID